MHHLRDAVRALKGHPDAIVCVTVAVSALAALDIGTSALATVFIVGLALLIYCARRAETEHHERQMADRKIAMEAEKTRQITAQFIELRTEVEPRLQLGQEPENAPRSGKK